MVYVFSVPSLYDPNKPCFHKIAKDWEILNKNLMSSIHIDRLNLSHRKDV